MSSQPFPVPAQMPKNVRFLAVTSKRSPLLFMPERRRPTAEQGRALEMLGHALDYLVDSRMASEEEGSPLADQDAVRLISWCSRELFAACPEVPHVAVRMRRWLSGQVVRSIR